MATRTIALTHDTLGACPSAITPATGCVRLEKMKSAASRSGTQTSANATMTPATNSVMVNQSAPPTGQVAAIPSATVRQTD